MVAPNIGNDKGFTFKAGTSSVLATLDGNALILSISLGYFGLSLSLRHKNKLQRFKI